MTSSIGGPSTGNVVVGSGATAVVGAGAAVGPAGVVGAVGGVVVGVWPA